MAALPKLGVAVVTIAVAGKVPVSTLRVLNSDSGLVRYSVPFAAGEDVDLVSSGSRLIAADADGEIIAYDAKNGETLWQQVLPFKLSASPAISDQSIVIGTQDKKLYLVDITTGRTTATVPVDRNVTSVYVRENGMIVAGDERGNVINYRDSAGSVWWKFKSGGRIGTIVETSDGVLVGSFDNFIYMLSKYTGDVKWKRRLDGRIVSAPTVFDGYLLAASSTEVNAQVLDLGNGKPVDQLQFGANNLVLGSPFVSDDKFAIFTLVGGIAAFSPSDCSAK
jgi:outer membrane protein assembly factor BamB